MSRPAPRRDTARWSEFDSALITAQIKRTGTACCCEASATTDAYASCDHEGRSPLRESRVNAARRYFGAACAFAATGAASLITRFGVSALARPVPATTLTTQRAIR